MGIKRMFLLAILCHAGLGFGSSPLKIGLVLNKAGKNDKSFNAGAYAGLTKAEKEFGFETKTVEASDDNAFFPALRGLAERQYNLIIAVGFSQAEAVSKVAPKYPKTNFVLVDAVVDGPNIRSLIFEEHEGSFLAGALGAMVSKTKHIGFVGGMDIPLIRRFFLGYEAGAKVVNKDMKVVSSYIGNTADAWINPARGKELALAQMQGGADVVYSVAGSSGTGVFDAAEQQKTFAIGVDANQNWMKPGRILTSMMKRVDVGVYDACHDLQKGKFSPGKKSFGLKNNGVELAFDEHNKSLVTAEQRKKLDELRQAIIDGKIVVPDYYKTKS